MVSEELLCVPSEDTFATMADSNHMLGSNRPPSWGGHGLNRLYFQNRAMANDCDQIQIFVGSCTRFARCDRFLGSGLPTLFVIKDSERISKVSQKSWSVAYSVDFGSSARKK